MILNFLHKAPSLINFQSNNPRKQEQRKSGIFSHNYLFGTYYLPPKAKVFLNEQYSTVQSSLLYSNEQLRYTDKPRITGQRKNHKTVKNI